MNRFNFLWQSKEFLQNVCPVGLLFFKNTRFCFRSVRIYVSYKEGFSLTSRLPTSTYTLMRVLMGIPHSQLTTNFSAKYELTTILGANSQLTTKRG